MTARERADITAKRLMCYSRFTYEGLGDVIEEVINGAISDMHFYIVTIGELTADMQIKYGSTDYDLVARYWWEQRRLVNGERPYVYKFNLSPIVQFGDSAQMSDDELTEYCARKFGES